jgi:pimeloyl-ACP methyl ester carboxylesterase
MTGSPGAVGHPVPGAGPRGRGGRRWGGACPVPAGPGPDGLDRGLHGGEEVHRPISSSSAAALDLAAYRVLQLSEHQGYDNLDVLGVSFGGVLAQQLAHQAPNLVRRLVLAATAAGSPLLGGVPGSPRALLALATPRRYRSPDYYRRKAGTVYGGEARRDPDALLDGSAARFAEPPSLRGYLDQLFAIGGWTGLPWLWRLRQPTLLLLGDDDPIVPVVNGKILARLIPDARLEVVQGGHLFLLERPAEMAALIADFLLSRAACEEIGGPGRPPPP